MSENESNAASGPPKQSTYSSSKLFELDLNNLEELYNPNQRIIK